MKNTRYIFILVIAFMPFVTSALTFEMPRGRELTIEEKKLGSVYRGCIGFHCLEEEPELAVALAVSSEPCASGEAVRSGDIEGEGYACLTLDTNAREGAVVLMASNRVVRTCPDELSEGMRAMEGLENGCAEVSEQVPVMGTEDSAEDAFGRLKLSDIKRSGRINLLSVIAY